MKRLALAALGAISLTACAQSPAPSAATQATATAVPAAAAPVAAPPAGSPEARAIAAINTINPRIKVDRVVAAPLPGFRQAVVGGQVVYVSDDGRHVLVLGNDGALFETAGKRNLSEQALGEYRKQLLATIAPGERIRFAPANPVHTVTVFTDVECGYCQKLHGEIAEYNRQGIAVEYLAFPRMGLGSEDYRKMVSVWCAPDRRRALTDAKSMRSVATRDCKTSVNQQYAVGQRIGLTGTPMILNEDGLQLGGYVPPAQLRQALDTIRAQKAKPGA